MNEALIFYKDNVCYKWLAVQRLTVKLVFSLMKLNAMSVTACREPVKIFFSKLTGPQY